MPVTDFSSNSAAPIVMRFGAFGDMIMLLPMLRFLARQTAQPVDLISSGGWTAPLMQAQSAVNEVRLLTSRKAPYWTNSSQRDMVQWLRSQRGRPVLLCETDEKSRWFARKAGLPPETVFWAGDEPMRAGEHWIERWLRIAHHCYGQTFEQTEVRAELSKAWLEIGADAQADCARWLLRKGWSERPLILIQAGSKRTMRRGSVDRRSNVKFWPQEHWVDFGQKLLARHPDAQLIFCGSPQEAEYAAGLAAGLDDPRAESVADDLPIPRLLALQTRALAMLSVDTGPAHAAAAMGCPLVVLFGAMQPALWRPYAVNAPVEVVRADDPVDVRSIRPAQVEAAWTRLLDAADSGRLLA